MTYHVSHWRWIISRKAIWLFWDIDVLSTHWIGLMQAKRISTHVVSKNQAPKVVSKKYKGKPQNPRVSEK